MKLKLIGIFFLGFLSFAGSAYANEVLLTADQPMKITFRIAHKNPNKQPVFGEIQSIELSKNVNVPVALDDYERAGIVIVSVNGHELPPSANQFNEPEQCSMTTDKTKATGALSFQVSKHSINCRSYGGVFY